MYICDTQEKQEPTTVMIRAKQVLKHKTLTSQSDILYYYYPCPFYYPSHRWWDQVTKSQIPSEGREVTSQIISPKQVIMCFTPE